MQASQHISTEYAYSTFALLADSLLIMSEVTQSASDFIFLPPHWRAISSAKVKGKYEAACLTTKRTVSTG
jgi:hypothetical protein